MEDQLVQLLANTQLPDQAPRQQAELELLKARKNPAFPVSLAKVASHTSISTAVRQSALTSLRLFIEANWVADDPEDEPVIPIDEETRTFLRQGLLDLVLSEEDDRKIKISASYVIGKIATHDFPEQWPELLSAILKAIPSSTHAQLHGALRVLSDMVRDSLSESQFFFMARDIAKTLTEVALDENRKPMLRALAISVFRSCFDLMQMVKDDHSAEVKAFAEELLAQWNPFFLTILKTLLPEADLNEGMQPETWNDLIALKLQVVKTLLRIRKIFPNLLLPQSTVFFTSVWEELNHLQAPHHELFVKRNAQSRLENADGMPYTLDFLVLEEIDFLNQCFRSPPVKAELETQLQAHSSGQDVPWIIDIMRLLVSFSRITQEEEMLWEIDCSLFFAEEASVSANYTARTAAGDLLIKLGEWFNEKALDGLFGYTKSLFPGGESAWRSQESALYLFTMLLGDFQDLHRPIPDAVASAYVALVDFTINRPDEPLLRARGFLVAGSISRCVPTPPALLDRMISSVTDEDSEVVQVACINALEGMINSGLVDAERQVPIITAVQSYINGKDSSELQEADELLIVLAQTLRAAIRLDPKVALRADVPSTDLLFLLARLGACNFQATLVIAEAFEEIVGFLSDRTSFDILCGRTLPTLMGAFDVAEMTANDPLVIVAVELLAILAKNGPEPLPEGFVAAVFPKLNHVLMRSSDGEVLRPGAEAVKWILCHDHQQVFNWHDANGRSGLEVCLVIIDRLLGPSIEDNSASEVGGLAAELVEKAGQERLGPFLPQLLQAVAIRLTSAQAAAFIQSLILVFARLSLHGAPDVVEFLSQIQINGESGLQVVLVKWLENSVNFAGYDEIRQNVIALSKLYRLNDPRLSQIKVKGDLIMTADDGRIKTRSRSKKNPDQFTIIPAQLKIVKLLVEELTSASGVASAAGAAAAAIGATDLDEDNDEDGWEDDDTLDLSLGATRAELMSYLEAGAQRRPDDETHSYLVDFFVQCGRENVANFQSWYDMLSEDEKAKLNLVANSAAQ